MSQQTPCVGSHCNSSYSTAIPTRARLRPSGGRSTLELHPVDFNLLSADGRRERGAVCRGKVVSLTWMYRPTYRLKKMYNVWRPSHDLYGLETAVKSAKRLRWREQARLGERIRRRQWLGSMSRNAGYPKLQRLECSRYTHASK